MHDPVVLKFGGTSVEDPTAFERFAAIVPAHGGERPVVVVSAMKGVTDALLKAADLAAAGDPAAGCRLLAPHLARHEAVARRFATGETAAAAEREIARAGDLLAALLERVSAEPAARAPLRDEIAAWGERLSSAMAALALEARGLPARAVDACRLIVTDDRHGGATPLQPDTNGRLRAELLPMIHAGTIPVLGGFVGATREGRTTTLGRGGSDYSAAVIGAALDAAEIQIWTDVSGVLTADPRIVAGAYTIPRLSYAEAAELAYFGAKVLHPRTIQPALDRGIPVRICNARAPDEPGTLVTADADVWPDTVKAIAHKTGITIVQVTSARMLGAYGFLRALFEVFDRHHTAVDVVSTSEVSVSLSVEGGELRPEILADLGSLGQVRVETERAIVCVVGEGLRRTPGIAARVFQTIRDVNVLLISQGASQVNLTFVVDAAHVAGAVARLHDALLARSAVATAGGPGWHAESPPDVCALARRLIDIPSVSGEEAGLAHALAAYLTELGWRVELADAVPGRPNLLATTGAPPTVVLCTHLDTVPPFLGAEDDGTYIHGRGACDAKGILAAQIAAAERLRAEGVSELGLLFVVDEEMGSLGARAANAHPRARECRYVVVGEPTDNRLVVGCKGSLRLSLHAEGSGGHSAYPERGVSAIDRLLAVLADVRAARWPADEFFGETTINVGIIAGGSRTNVLAAEARADLHVRLVTGPDAVKRQLEQLVDGRAEIEYLSVTPPVRLTAVPGFEQCVVGFTTDTAHLGHWGRPLVLGPGSILDAHTGHERIARAELLRGVELYVRLVRALLAAPAPAATEPAGAGAEA
jgi:aspartate kinase